jgi:hypothetical protein
MFRTVDFEIFFYLTGGARRVARIGKRKVNAKLYSEYMKEKGTR